MITEEIVNAMDRMIELCKDPVQAAGMSSMREMLCDFDESAWSEETLDERLSSYMEAKSKSVVLTVPYVSVWDGYSVESTAEVDIINKKIVSIKIADLDDSMLESLQNLDYEYIVLNDERVIVEEDMNGNRFYE